MTPTITSVSKRTVHGLLVHTMCLNNGYCYTVTEKEDGRHLVTFTISVSGNDDKTVHTVPDKDSEWIADWVIADVENQIFLYGM